MIKRIGVISDTHGAIRTAVAERLAGVELILHAGDVGDAFVLQDLGRIAKTLAVRGNVDHERGVRELPATLAHEVAQGLWVYVLHDLAQLDLSASVAGFRAVISGHSHMPKLEERDGVLYLNPGSCGPRRARLPVSMAMLHVDHRALRAELIMLDE